MSPSIKRLKTNLQNQLSEPQNRSKKFRDGSWIVVELATV